MIVDVLADSNGCDVNIFDSEDPYFKRLECLVSRLMGECRKARI